MMNVAPHMIEQTTSERSAWRRRFICNEVAADARGARCRKGFYRTTVLSGVLGGDSPFALPPNLKATKARDVLASPPGLKYRVTSMLDSADQTPNPDAWEAAYLRFETPDQEIRKFMARLNRLGAQRWPRDSQIVELFCGRGSGLHALSRLGFTRVEGVDLSARLIAEYRGAGEVSVCDCRHLAFPDSSRDILIVQGGLHHLPKLPEDLAQTLREAHRVLRTGGLLIAVEPWLTPFLRFTHAIARNPFARRAWPKLDALQTMIEHETETYEQWLRNRQMIMDSMREYFHVEMCATRWGKLMFAGRKK
jgi:SAM-dependent methyltransferase